MGVSQLLEGAEVLSTCGGASETNQGGGGENCREFC